MLIAILLSCSYSPKSPSRCDRRPSRTRLGLTMARVLELCALPRRLHGETIQLESTGYVFTSSVRGGGGSARGRYRRRGVHKWHQVVDLQVATELVRRGDTVARQTFREEFSSVEKLMRVFYIQLDEDDRLQVMSVHAAQL